MADNPPNAKAGKVEATKTDKAPHCGIVMPIAAMGTYDASHWVRVRDVLNDAIEEAGFTPRLVSESDDVGVIHGHIVQNLYADEIVVCDVSGRNANVMFELGMRLAFDKPTIIVKDDDTDFSFDTQVIKHLLYRRDQRFDDVLRFKGELRDAIKATLDKKKEDVGYSPFLKHFGNFIPKSIENKEVPQVEYIMRTMEQVREEMRDVMMMMRRNEVFNEEKVLKINLDNAKRARHRTALHSMISSAIDTAYANHGTNAPLEVVKQEAKRFLRRGGLSEADMEEVFNSVWESKFGNGKSIFDN